MLRVISQHIQLDYIEKGQQHLHLTDGDGYDVYPLLSQKYFKSFSL
jgi:hypothetical protein